MKITLLSIELAPSMGLRIIQQILLNGGHDAKLVHIPMQRVDIQFIKKVADQVSKFVKNDRLIGISCMSNTFIQASELITLLKKKISIPIILGGVHPTFKPEECLEYADYVCVGEGEEAMLELANNLECGKRIDNIKNIWLKRNNLIIKNPQRPIIKDLNILPIPCFDVLRLFAWNNGIIRSIGESNEILRKFFDYWYSIMTSRGCPFKCKYCVNDAFCLMDSQYRKIRRRKDDLILQELKIAKRVIGNFIVNFVDDDFIVRDTDDLEIFLEKYKKEIGLPFFCAGTPTAMTSRKIEMLIMAGVKRIQIGIQSINEHVNNNIYGRYTTKKQIYDMINIISRYRHRVLFVFDIILDTPWEKDDTRIETLRFILTIRRPREIWLNSMTLYPGTSLYERAKKEGILKDEKEEIYNKSFYSLEPSSVNSLFLLFTKFRFPRFAIRGLIVLRSYGLVDRLLKNSTYFLLHLYYYIEGFKNVFKLKKFNLFLDYLVAPARLITIKLEGKKRTGV